MIADPIHKIAIEKYLLSPCPRLSRWPPRRSNWLPSPWPICPNLDEKKEFQANPCPSFAFSAMVTPGAELIELLVHVRGKPTTKLLLKGLNKFNVKTIIMRIVTIVTFAPQPRDQAPQPLDEQC